MNDGIILTNAPQDTYSMRYRNKIAELPLVHDMLLYREKIHREHPQTVFFRHLSPVYRFLDFLEFTRAISFEENPVRFFTNGKTHETPPSPLRKALDAPLQTTLDAHKNADMVQLIESQRNPFVGEYKNDYIYRLPYDQRVIFAKFVRYLSECRLPHGQLPLVFPSAVHRPHHRHAVTDAQLPLGGATLSLVRQLRAMEFGTSTKFTPEFQAAFNKKTKELQKWAEDLLDKDVRFNQYRARSTHEVLAPSSMQT